MAMFENMLVLIIVSGLCIILGINSDYFPGLCNRDVFWEKGT
jgi:hypothetical protein